MSKPGEATPEEVILMLTRLPGSRHALACRPKDWNAFPADKRPDAMGVEMSPITDYVEGVCEMCGLEILIGPKQNEAISRHRDSYWVVDLLCAVQMAVLAQKSGAHVDHSDMDQANLERFRGTR